MSFPDIWRGLRGHSSRINMHESQSTVESGPANSKTILVLDDVKKSDVPDSG